MSGSYGRPFHSHLPRPRYIGRICRSASSQRDRRERWEIEPRLKSSVPGVKIERVLVEVRAGDMTVMSGIAVSCTLSFRVIGVRDPSLSIHVVHLEDPILGGAGTCTCTCTCARTSWSRVEVRLVAVPISSQPQPTVNICHATDHRRASHLTHHLA